VATSAITGALSFATFDFFVTGAFAIIATGTDLPMTALAIISTAGGTAATAAAASRTAPGIGAEKIFFAFITSAGAATVTVGKEKSAASAAMTILRVGRGVRT
jgi:hypothetical protein